MELAAAVRRRAHRRLPAGVGVRRGRGGSPGAGPGRAVPVGRPVLVDRTGVLGVRLDHRPGVDRRPGRRPTGPARTGRRRHGGIHRTGCGRLRAGPAEGRIRLAAADHRRGRCWPCSGLVADAGVGPARPMGPAGQRLRAVGGVDARQGGRRGVPGAVARGPAQPQPRGSWSAGDGLAYATSENGPPDARWLWNGTSPGPAGVSWAPRSTWPVPTRTDRLGSLHGPGRRALRGRC